MNVGTARAAAEAWIGRHVADEDWFVGAYYSGSTAGLPDDAPVPIGSDVDVMVVTSEDEPPLKPGKLVFEGALLEITLLPWRSLRSPEAVLSDYHLAAGLRSDTIFADPSGRLRVLQREVARRFAEPVWVRKRCEQARQRAETGLASLNRNASRAELVMGWLFPTGITAHVVLVAARRNPTVRLRYDAARQVLAAFGREDVYAEMLRLLGCASWTPELTSRHLDELAVTFDAAAAAAKTPAFFLSDIAAAARPIAIDGARELIRTGRHREAVFWMGVTFARCHRVFENDAPELDRSRGAAFDAFLRDLGVDSVEALLRRAEEARRYIPTVWSVAERIMSAEAGERSESPQAGEGGA